jgi:hypothetical protein
MTSTNPNSHQVSDFLCLDLTIQKRPNDLHMRLKMLRYRHSHKLPTPRERHGQQQLIRKMPSNHGLRRQVTPRGVHRRLATLSAETPSSPKRSSSAGPFGLLPSPGTASQAREPDSPSGFLFEAPANPLLHPCSNLRTNHAPPTAPTLGAVFSWRDSASRLRRLTSSLRYGALRSQIEQQMLSFYVGN